MKRGEDKGDDTLGKTRESSVGCLLPPKKTHSPYKSQEPNNFLLNTVNQVFRIEQFLKCERSNSSVIWKAGPAQDGAACLPGQSFLGHVS